MPNCHRVITVHVKIGLINISPRLANGLMLVQIDKTLLYTTL